MAEQAWGCGGEACYNKGNRENMQDSQNNRTTVLGQEGRAILWLSLVLELR